MNIETFRHAFGCSLKLKGRTVNSVAKELGLEQASLYRFLYNNRGISGEYVCKLLPFVYGDILRFPEACEQRLDIGN